MALSYCRHVPSSKSWRKIALRPTIRISTERRPFVTMSYSCDRTWRCTASLRESETHHHSAARVGNQTEELRKCVAHSGSLVCCARWERPLSSPNLGKAPPEVTTTATAKVRLRGVEK